MTKKIFTKPSKKIRKVLPREGPDPIGISPCYVPVLNDLSEFGYWL